MVKKHLNPHQIAVMATYLRFQQGMNYQEVCSYIETRTGMSQADIEDALYESDNETIGEKL